MRLIMGKPEKGKPYHIYVEETEKRIGAFREFDPARLRGESAGEGPLSGLPLAVQENIAVRGFRQGCGSRMLEGFVSPVTATAVRRLQDRGAVVAGTTKMEEFGLPRLFPDGVSGKEGGPERENPPGGACSPRDDGHPVGGAASAVAAGMAAVALASDGEGEVRRDAAACGVYGLRPSWGVVSRRGLASVSPSLETVGVVAGTAARVREVFRIIRGRDDGDPCSRDHPADAGPGGRRIGTYRISIEPSGEEAWRAALDSLGRRGFSVREAPPPMMEHWVPVYQALAAAETASSLARFDGVRFGRRSGGAEDPESLVRRARGEGFGIEVKLRILLGTHILRPPWRELFHDRAVSQRAAIRRAFDEYFGEVDMVLLPVSPPSAPGDRDGDDHLPGWRNKDRFNLAAALAGLPALSFPVTTGGGRPVGLQLMGPPFGEERLFEAAEALAEDFPPASPPGLGRDWR